MGAQMFSVTTVSLMLAVPVTAETVSVTLPEVSLAAQAGGPAFSENYAQCHGMIASGTDNGHPSSIKFTNPTITATSHFRAQFVRGHGRIIGDSATCHCNSR
jgi:hypothetical protein